MNHINIFHPFLHGIKCKGILASVALLMASSSVVGCHLSSHLSSNWRQMGGDRSVMKHCSSMADVIASEGYDYVNSFFNSDAKSLTFSTEG